MHDEVFASFHGEMGCCRADPPQHRPKRRAMAWNTVLELSLTVHNNNNNITTTTKHINNNNSNKS